MVMLIVVVFAILAGGLAYTMKVETTLARNSSWDMELEWLGRSGIEMAKYVLSQPHQAGMQYDALEPDLGRRHRRNERRAGQVFRSPTTNWATAHSP